MTPEERNQFEQAGISTPKAIFVAVFLLAILIGALNGLYKLAQQFIYSQDLENEEWTDFFINPMPYILGGVALIALLSFVQLISKK